MIDYQNITDNEIRRIVSQAADPAEQVQILRDLTGKSVPYIKRAAGMDLSPAESLKEERSKNYGWTEADIQYVKDNPGKPLAEQAAYLGKAVATVANMRRRLGIKEKLTWGEKEIEKLVKLWNQGMKQAHIALKLGRSEGSVQGKVQTLKKKGVITDDGRKRKKVKSVQS